MASFICNYLEDMVCVDSCLSACLVVCVRVCMCVYVCMCLCEFVLVRANRYFAVFFQIYWAFDGKHIWTTIVKQGNSLCIPFCF